MTPPTIITPTDPELDEYLVFIKSEDDNRHPYTPFPPRPKPPAWRGGPTLTKGEELAYRDETADYDGASW